MHDRTWTDIGTALGVTRQAVQQRFHAPHKRYPAERLTEELRTAMAEVKRAVVQHWNNYIGTEHLLWGLTAAAQDNGATRWLRDAGMAPEEVHRAVAARLSTGASQAAERIAWTSYSRKAMALAQERAEGEGRELIDCADLLLGLVRIDRGVAATVLTEAGLATAPTEDGLATVSADAGLAAVPAEDVSQDGLAAADPAQSD
ncbi:hypothetical protein HUT18_22325 [Streptomyces sp. NA04227]|nr:hypothetical protein HUT18_22325 [Streptomyces sp. NA04227]